MPGTDFVWRDESGAVAMATSRGKLLLVVRVANRTSRCGECVKEKKIFSSVVAFSPIDEADVRTDHARAISF